MTNKQMTIDFMINHIIDNTRIFGAFYIQFNRPKHYFQTVQDTLHLQDDYQEGEGYESIEDYQECKKTNVVYEVIWYPHNSLSSYNTFGSTLEKALVLMFKICEEERVSNKEKQR